MGFLPFEQHKVLSPLDANEVISRLNKVIGQEGVLKEYTFGSTPYYGKIIDPYFTASRIAAYRLLSRGLPFNMPVINGRVQPELTGCSIDFSISPANIGKKGAVLLAGIMGLMFIICLAAFIWSAIESRSAGQIISLILMGLFTFMYLIHWIIFKIEAITYRNYFYKIFEVETNS
jgi:hypothetical protein